jgi:hypothetical protein
MKRWALVVLGLYLLMLVVLAAPLGVVAFMPMKLHDAVQVYLAWEYWLWVAVMLLAQAALLKVPVQLTRGRPITRRSLVLPVLVGGLMLGGLAAVAVLSVGEAIFGEHMTGAMARHGLVAGAFTWCFWGVVFFRMSRSLEPAGFISRQCKLLLEGSILELLVAVPSHIVVRCRNYCCAGFMTFLGLSFGIAVMLFSFGPSVFFLYAARWRRLHPQTQATPAATSSDVSTR